MLLRGMALACVPVSWYVETRKEEITRNGAMMTEIDHRDDVSIVNVSHSASVRRMDMTHSIAATRCRMQAHDDKNPYEVPRLSPIIAAGMRLI